MNSLPPNTILIFFDGTCDFCTACAIVIRRLDYRRRLALVPFQWTNALHSVGLTTEQAEVTLWVVQPDGTKYSGATAVCEVADNLLAGHVFRWICNLPLVGTGLESAYAFLARNRSKLPGVTPAVQRPDGWRTQRDS